MPPRTTAKTTNARPRAAVRADALPGARAVLGMEDTAPYLADLLADAAELKRLGHAFRLPKLLEGRAILMVYEKNSTRTRVSFEVGVQRLGGIAVNLDSQTSQLSRGESIEDTAQVLSRYGHALVYRAKSHASVEALARYATVPVVNALTDVEHPCQILADWQTLAEHWGSLQGRTFAYVGDGNNMCHSYLLGAPLAGMNVQVATPKGYDPDPEIVERAKALAAAAGTTVKLVRKPEDAIKGADAVATDTWVSMGDEAEETQRMKAFAGYTIDEAMMQQAKPDAVFLHCLPGHWGQEATYELAHGPRSLIYDEAENRMWAQMALLCRLLDIKVPRPDVW
ncbi:MAG: ornithine carbamoyltransferase [Thermoplasmata archaeon]|jgi:ornithine carbamoyltransferase|nr:ornithine carbamoyltransferase [Thermoplasmata archaeon]